MRMAGGLVRKTRMPGTRASFGRSSSMIWSAVERALGARLQIDVEARAAAADVRGERRDVRILRQDVHDLLHVPDHGLVADALNRLDLAAELTGVDARDEALRDRAKQIDGADQQQRARRPSSCP